MYGKTRTVKAFGIAAAVTIALTSIILPPNGVPVSAAAYTETTESQSETQPVTTSRPLSQTTAQTTLAAVTTTQTPPAAVTEKPSATQLTEQRTTVTFRQPSSPATVTYITQTEPSAVPETYLAQPEAAITSSDASQGAGTVGATQKTDGAEAPSPIDISSAEITVTGYYKPIGRNYYIINAMLGDTVLGKADLEYTLPKQAGTHTVIISGKGMYTGKKEAVCTILPADISEAAISVKKSQLHNGYDYCVKYGAYTLIMNTDYTVQTSETETAHTVTVTGTGNFSGTKSYTYTKEADELQQDKVRERLDEMMAGEHDRQIYSYVHSYKVGNYYNTLLTSACTCHSYCEWHGLTSGCTCLIGRSTVLDRYGIQCAGFTYEVFEYLFGGTNKKGDNILHIYDRTDAWTTDGIKEWMTKNLRPGDYLAYTNIKYGYDHYVTVYSVDGDGVWIYEANYGGRCKINFRKMTFSEFYDQTDDLWHRTPVNYELSE